MFPNNFDDEKLKLTVNAVCCCTSVTKIHSFYRGSVTTIIAAQLNKIISGKNKLYPVCGPNQRNNSHVPRSDIHTYM